MKAVASFRGDDNGEGGRIISRRRGRRQGEDSELHRLKAEAKQQHFFELEASTITRGITTT
jgi:hypothetical protein